MDTSNVWRGGWVQRLRRVGVVPLVLIGLFAVGASFIPVSYELHERLVVSAFGCAVYLAVFLLSIYLFSDPVRREGEGRRLAFGRVFAWVRLWHGMVFAAVFSGGLIGGLLFALVGALIGSKTASTNLFLSGLRDGAFYVFIWAPGASLIACVMLAFYGRKT